MTSNATLAGSGAHARRPADLSSTTLAVYDLAFAALAILVATDALNRFDVAGPVWYLVYLLAVVRIALAWRSFFDTLMRNLVYLAFPAVCLASTLWSQAQSFTLLASIQLTMTVVVAMVIGWRLSLTTICLMQFTVTGFTIALSLLNWATGVFGAIYSASGGVVGIFTQKHMLAQRSLFTAVASIAILLMPLGRWAAMWRLAALASIPFVLFAVVLSTAVTSILLTPVFMVLLLALCSHLMPRALVFAGVAGAVLVLTFVPLTLAILNIEPVSAILQAFDKNPTLTGRTELWDIAGLVLHDHALLGVGYKAFWNTPKFLHYALLAKAIGGETVGSFHNFVLENLVGTGIVGFSALAALLLTTAWRTGILFLHTRMVTAAYALTLTVAGVALALVGSSLQRPHEGILMFVVMVGVSAERTLSYRRRMLAAPRRAARSLDGL